MKLYDNDACREEFIMELVYDLLRDDGTNDRANQIIDAFDSVPEVEAEPLQPPTKLDRSLWEGCPYCTFSLVETDYCGGIKYEWNRGQSLLEYEDSVHIDDKYGGDYCCLIFYDEDNGETEVGIKYCPICGKPLTEEAWAELERKIGGNDGT